MISKLRGVLDSTGDNWAVLDVSGVFYQVFCSRKTLAEVRDTGTTYTLFTEMQVREDLMALYGFATQDEQEWFKVLTSVQGVGMKVGLAILSAATPSEMHSALACQDKTLFTKADGVGPKLAGRLVNELKDKVAKAFGSSPATPEGASVVSLHGASPVSKASSLNDAASALVNLGYKPFEANQALAQLQQQGQLTPDTPVGEAIRIALTHMTKVRA